MRTAKIALAKEDMKFSAAHFTIFSETERERLHGHNFQVSATIEAPIVHNGMGFSYKVYKDKLRECCDALDEYLILPANSPYLSIADEGIEYVVSFNGETMRFLKADTLLLPIANATVEEFSHYILRQLAAIENDVEKYQIQSIVVGVSSGAGQWGYSEWQQGEDMA